MSFRKPKHCSPNKQKCSKCNNAKCKDMDLWFSFKRKVLEQETMEAEINDAFYEKNNN